MDYQLSMQESLQISQGCEGKRVVCCKILQLLYLVLMKGNQSLHKIQGEIVAA